MKVAMSILLSEDIYRKLKKEKKETGKSMSSIIEEALRRYFSSEA